MERFNWQKRLQGIGRKGVAAPHGSQATSRPRGKLPLIVTLSIVGFLVLAVLASLFSSARQALPAIVNSDKRAPMAQPTTAAAMPRTGGDAPASSMSNVEGQPQLPAESGAGGSTAQTTGPGNTQTNKDWDRMIIRTATLQLKVKDVAASMDEVRTLAGAHAGYVTQSDSHQEGDYTVASITMQVPAAEFDNTMSQLRKAGLKVLNEQSSSSDVTEEYTDLNSQLRNLQATEQRVLALTQKADKIDDILTLDRELREIQGEIERIQGRVNFLSKRTQMSTITVSLYPDVPAVGPTARPVEGWDPIGIATHAWDASLALLANIGTLVITIAVFLWWAVPLLILTWLFARRNRRVIPAPPTPAES